MRTQFDQVERVRAIDMAAYSLLPLALVVGGELVEELVVELHERLEDAVDERDDRLVPVLLRDAVERREHDRQNHVAVLLDQAHYVLVIPVVQRSLRHLAAECACVCILYFISYTLLHVVFLNGK